MTDALDKRLILELSKDGRKSYVQIAKLLCVTETTIRKRVKALVRSGLITITALPDIKKLGYIFTAIVGIQIRLSDIKTVSEKLLNHPNICYVSNVTGRFDFIFIVATHNSDEFASFMEKFIAPINGIIRTETFVTLKNYKGKYLSSDTIDLIKNETNLES
jgi:Lrp/AsnC family transcriptional regulator, regulator for asnA, asnC and gidA